MPLNKGDVLYSSWGYDQTNIDFYEVKEVKPSGKMVVIQKMADSSTPEKGFMTAEKMPVFGKNEGDPMLKKVGVNWDGKPSIKIESYAYAQLWDGKPKSYSWYA
jgi:hypothetical protein